MMDERRPVIGNTKLKEVGKVAETLAFAIRNTSMEYDSVFMQQGLRNLRDQIDDILKEDKK